MTTQDLAAVPTEPVSMAEIKEAYPGEWVLIAQPVWDESNLHILSGIPLCHSFDKREIAYGWREKVKAYGKFTLHFNRVVVPGEKPRSILPSLRRISPERLLLYKAFQSKKSDKNDE